MVLRIIILAHYRAHDEKAKIPEQDWPQFAISWSNNNGGADDASALALMTRHISAVGVSACSYVLRRAGACTRMCRNPSSPFLSPVYLHTLPLRHCVPAISQLCADSVSVSVWFGFCHV